MQYAVYNIVICANEAVGNRFVGKQSIPNKLNQGNGESPRSKVDDPPFAQVSGQSAAKMILMD